MSARREQVDTVAVPNPQPYNLDDFGGPTGSSITIKGIAYYFASDDDLSVDDRENLRRFSLRLREMESWEGDEDTGMMTQQQQAQIASMQVAMCQIALPECPFEVLSGLKPIQRTKALDIFFTKEVGDLTWIDRTVWRWIQNRHRPAPATHTISGTSTTTKTGASSAGSGSDTSVESPPSAASTEEVTESGEASTA